MFLLQLQPGESVTTMLSIEDFSGEYYLTMLTRCGLIKKTELNAFKNIRRGGLIAINLDEDDSLGWVEMTNGSQDIFIGTAMVMRNTRIGNASSCEAACRNGPRP